ncbi:MULTISPECIES: polysaccharide deacetylase family protein [unclassified Agrobacterium]|uniref:polysaccharide deacetylase family protein n=1 Tax=unclassified Agrobacterium TaxID=2632611 RepID=UPI002448E3EB|nr:MULTISPECIES: polysaccharide deacetylase family protein [unclassified Agrobacterium]MDH0613103.1 polysaccharide deacetylase family protein [Agrobacterium sp. GD03872]MDH0694968.1 polysaccharide deacetylase family protein [Agrobacterium sp. GD03871]MDH1057634.1 polysaccharide deacetylase family protein [Agrobacterium sp. GD03992]MDH2208923.1 polysaccharide deacetylase family protein [Agrobacterium sp. GD03643]MDH2218414.1 polysaccharide deacetylase family protein [Agrobacterium sp. GD03638]
MTQKIGTIADRVNNRLVRYFPGPAVRIETSGPIVSFTFDDVPATAWTNGARILEDEGVRGTFYIAGTFIDGHNEQQEMISAKGCSELAAAGHELACHTYSHRKLSSFSRRGLAEDLDRNDSVLGSFDGKRHRQNFSVPFGMASPIMQPLLRRRFRTARGIMPGINRGGIDPHNLAAVELRSDRNYLDAADRWLDEALQNGGWLVIFTHDVSATPSFYGCPEERFRGLVRRATSGGAKVMTVDAAASALGL